jgi:hypothetical protein
LKTEINYRKNIVRTLFRERAELKSLKTYKGCWDDDDFRLQDKLILQSEAKIEVLVDLLKPYRKGYY